MDSSDLENLRAGIERFAKAARDAAEALEKAFAELTQIVGVSAEEATSRIEEALRFLQAMENAAEQVEEQDRDRKRFRRCERAENARRAAKFKQYSRAVMVTRKHQRPRTREFKPP